MMKRDVPVYLITGFLESGKTQFLDFTIHQSYFQIPDKTLLILCEEGEEEYDEESLKKMNTVIEIIEKTSAWQSPGRVQSVVVCR